MAMLLPPGFFTLVVDAMLTEAIGGSKLMVGGVKRGDQTQSPISNQPTSDSLD